MDGWMYGSKEKQMDGWMDKTNRWMVGWIEKKIKNRWMVGWTGKIE